MNNNHLIEEYFVSFHKNFGISELSFRNQRIELDESVMKNLVFISEAFDEEFDNLLHHCSLIYKQINKGFNLKIRKDLNNNYLVNVI